MRIERPTCCDGSLARTRVDERDTENERDMLKTQNCVLCHSPVLSFIISRRLLEAEPKANLRTGAPFTDFSRLWLATHFSLPMPCNLFYTS